MSTIELARAFRYFGVGLLLPLPLIAMATVWGPVQYALASFGFGLIVLSWWLGRP